MSIVQANFLRCYDHSRDPDAVRFFLIPSWRVAKVPEATRVTGEFYPAYVDSPCSTEIVSAKGPKSALTALDGGGDTEKGHESATKLRECLAIHLNDNEGTWSRNILLTRRSHLVVHRPSWDVHGIVGILHTAYTSTLRKEEVHRRPKL